MQFINSFGTVESGIDAGGPAREFYELLGQRVFDPSLPFWALTAQGELYPSPDDALGEESYAFYDFAGCVLGKLIFEHVLTNARFARFFLSKLLGKATLVDDLHSLDPELYRHLLSLKLYAGDVRDLNLTFSVGGCHALAADACATLVTPACASGSCADGCVHWRHRGRGPHRARWH